MFFVGRLDDTVKYGRYNIRETTENINTSKNIHFTQSSSLRMSSDQKKKRGPRVKAGVAR
jgi:hypothetical protein